MDGDYSIQALPRNSLALSTTSQFYRGFTGDQTDTILSLTCKVPRCSS